MLRKNEGIKVEIGYSKKKEDGRERKENGNK